MYNESFDENDANSSILIGPKYCGYSEEINQNIVFWIEGVLLSAVGLPGVFGNAVTFYVLSKIPSRYNIFNNLLMQLVSGDSISIILVFIDFSLRRSFHVFNLDDVCFIWPTLIYPFIKISHTWIMCCTIAITLER